MYGDQGFAVGDLYTGRRNRSGEILRRVIDACGQGGLDLE
jgi:hypothetical protein